jgi:large subunit ribosomal protein L24
MNIRKGDSVIIIAGKDKGKRGKVKQMLPSKHRVVIEGVNLIKRHMRRGTARQAGIVEMEGPLHVSNLMLICSHCNSPSRIGHSTLPDGSIVRTCKSCGEVIDKS